MNRFLPLFLSLVLLCSCSESTEEIMYGNQDKKIESYIATLLKNKDAFVCYQDGVARVTVARTASAEADSLAPGGRVAFWYAGYVFNGSVTAANLFATNNKDVSTAWTISDTTLFEIANLRLGHDPLVSGLERGLSGVKGGDECYILFNGKYGFGDRILGTIPANSALAYHLWVESISEE